MSERQALSAPAAILDEAPVIRNALLSEHVLVQDGARISFFHEGFFDYAFARRFAARGGDLVKLLRSEEQHLFRRAQVRQILLHEREIDRQRYLKNLETLLTAEDIRFHIKQVVFALLAQFTDPAEAEWRILEALLQNPAYPNHREIWFAIRTPPWFKLLDSLTVIAAWLAQDESDTVDQAVMLMSDVRGDVADRVAELVEPYVGLSDKWRDRHRYLFQWAHLHAGRRFFDLFLRLIDNGDLDGAGRFHEDDFLGYLYDLNEKNAGWACEAIGRYLTRYLKISQDAGETNPFRDKGGLRHSQSADHVLIGSAQRAPAAFTEHVLPFMLRVIELNADRKRESLRPDTVWQWRFQDGGHTIDQHLLRAMEEALRKLARDAPEEFERVIAPLCQSPYETVQFLLLRSYSANGERFADDAIDYLSESPRRLNCGYSGSRHGASLELIQATTPHCSAERLAKLEGILLDYYTDYERTAGSGPWRGESQFALLLAIDEERRSDIVKGRIGQWQRKFLVQSPPEPPSSDWCQVISPISTSAAEKMTDDQWLRAIARYSENRERERRDGKFVGGAYELSDVLEAQTTKESTRFAQLVLRFPDETNPAYFNAVLRGLALGTAEPPAIFGASRRCHRLANRPSGSAFSYLVEKLPELTWPDDLLDAIAWYATEDPDPSRELWRTEANGGECYHGGDAYSAGINCVRGTAAGAVRALLYADADRLLQFLPVLRRMVRDPSIAVRSCVVTALLPILNRNYDRDLALELFVELCEAEEELLRTRYVAEFMGYATYTHFSLLKPIVERMLRSSEPEIAQAGARRACFASLGSEDAAELAQKCLVGSEPLRAGAAEIFAGNVGNARFSSVCEPLLVQLFDDSSEKVRGLAAKCFGSLEGDALGQATGLVERFESSEAFAANHEHLIRALEKTTARLPDVTISVCDRFIQIAGSAAGDMKTRAAGDAHRLSELIIRAYHQATVEPVRSRCLNSIDDLLRIGAMGLQRALTEFDR